MAVRDPHPDATPIKAASAELLSVYFPIEAGDEEIAGVLRTLAEAGLDGPAFKLDQPRSSHLELAIELWLQREALSVLGTVAKHVATDLLKKLVGHLSLHDTSAQAIRIAWDAGGGGSVVLAQQATAAQIRAAAEVIRAVRTDA
jgi:hypothetical protein